MLIFPADGAFVGRARDLDVLQTALADERVRTVLIEGEAGIGKSRLAGEFASRLGAGAAVLAGRCLDAAGDGLPFGPFVAVARDLLRLRGVDGLGALLPPHPMLGRWLPEVAAACGAPRPEPDVTALFGEILTVVEHLATEAPVVVVLEDLHWADASSVRALAFLATNLDARDVLVVGTYRAAETGRLSALLPQLLRDPSVRVIRPAPLTRHQVGRQLAGLLGREPDPGTIAQVFARSGGNPLFVEALSRSPHGAPADLDELLLAFLPELTPATRAVLRTASAAGPPVGHDLLAAAVDLSPDDLADAVADLVGRRLLRAGDEGYDFRHVLIRQAVHGQMLPAERVRLHRRLVSVLTARPDLLPPHRGPAELAHHAAAAGDTTTALTASWAAASAADGLGALAERLLHLDRVAALWDRVPDPAGLVGVDRLTLLEQITFISDGARDVRRGIAAAEEALALIDAAAEPLRAAGLHHFRDTFLHRLGQAPRYDEGPALSLTAGRPTSFERVNLLGSMAADALFRGDNAQAEDYAREAVRLSADLDDPYLVARATAFLALALSDADPEAAAAEFAAARAAALTAAGPQAIIMVNACVQASSVTIGAYGASLEQVQDSRRVAGESFRYAHAGPGMLIKWAQALAALGRWPEALDVIDDALADRPLPLPATAMLLTRAEIATALGDTAAAETSAEQAAELLVDGEWAGMYRIQLAAVRCRLALARGDVDAAAGVLADALVHGVGRLRDRPHESWALVELAGRVSAARVAAGRDAATQVPAALETLCQLVDTLPVTNPVDAAHQAAARAYGTARAEDWERVAGLWGAIERPYDQAQCLLAAARAHAATGSRSAAFDDLRGAAETADRLGAVPLAEAVRDFARRAGLDAAAGTDPRPATATARFGLTGRELDVLRLLATGMGNRQIAAELFISVNTAGVHVSRILAKLNAATRTEAAAVARDAGLLAGPERGSAG